MEIGIGLIAGVIVGVIIGFLIVQGMIKKSNQAKTEENNRKSDLILQEAHLAAKRVTEDANVKADRVIAKAEQKNENIKRKKIQEAKDRFNKMRSELDKEKAQHKLDLKDREVDVVKREEGLKQKTN
ncbi:MAG: ribonuclease Y, partial [Gammaproteobacteria bacterium]